MTTGSAGWRPRDFEAARARKVLRSIRREPSLNRRLEKITRQFIGSPYREDPLIGDAASPEFFAASLSGFDCVTFVETALAFAQARTVIGFLRRLRKLRYRDARLDWRHRNHYMTGWVRSNQRAGLVRNITRGRLTTGLSRRLSTLDGYPARRVRFRFFRKHALPVVADRIRDGDLIFFVSTWKNLDTFHLGMCFRRKDRILLRHASRSQGGVVEQELEEFMSKNSLPGFILVRPI
ncbi:MAG: DUF1460 domain-containing protein [Acidobacteria bacterium]|nr:DUF1460 domain-containing protein [Acidobacteriota bacterium]